MLQGAPPRAVGPGRTGLLSNNECASTIGRSPGGGSEMAEAIWYFDFISPFAYLQFSRLSRLPADLRVTMKPILFAALLEHHGHKGPAEIPSKRQFVYRFFKW